MDAQGKHVLVRLKDREIIDSRPGRHDKVRIVKEMVAEPVEWTRELLEQRKADDAHHFERLAKRAETLDLRRAKEAVVPARRQIDVLRKGGAELDQMNAAFDLLEQEATERAVELRRQAAEVRNGTGGGRGGA